MVERERCRTAYFLSNISQFTAKEQKKYIFTKIAWRDPTEAEYKDISMPIFSQKSYSVTGKNIKDDANHVVKIYKCHFYDCPYSAMSLMTKQFKNQYAKETGKSGAFLWHPDHTKVTVEDHDHEAHYEEAYNVEILVKNVFKTRDEFFKRKGSNFTPSMDLVNDHRPKDVYTTLVDQGCLRGSYLSKEYKFLVVGVIAMV